jgi:uncharacterized membrane protein YfcA
VPAALARLFRSGYCSPVGSHDAEKPLADENHVPSLWKALGLFAVAAIAGVVNSVAGGGTILTFPVLLASGLTGMGANATSTVALVPGSFGAAWGYRAEIAGDRRTLWMLALLALVGGALGAWLVLWIGNERFEAAAPWLMLGATLLFLANEWLGHRGLAGHRVPAVWLVLGAFAIAIYGGFFGAGMGILILVGLSFWGLSDIHRMNGLKAFATACTNVTAAIVFALSGSVDWPVAFLMAVGSVLGGLGGARLAHHLGQKLVRRLVVAIGLGFSAYLLARRAG